MVGKCDTTHPAIETFSFNLSICNASCLLRNVSVSHLIGVFLLFVTWGDPIWGRAKSHEIWGRRFVKFLKSDAATSPLPLLLITNEQRARSVFTYMFAAPYLVVAFLECHSVKGWRQIVWNVLQGSENDISLTYSRILYRHIRHGLVVRIAGSHPAGPGSIPGAGNLLLIT